MKDRLTINYDGDYVPKLACTIDRYGEADDCLEEQGLLLRLPCKVGDKVYVLSYGYGADDPIIITETEIIGIKKFRTGLFFEPLISRPAFLEEDFGKTVFLTREEAEKALEKMKGGTE